MKDSKNIIFVVGVGRSGTSLLQSMLSSHPAVSSPPETGFLRRLILSGLASKTYSRKGIQGLQELILKDEKIRRLDLNPDLDLSPAAGDKFADRDVYLSIMSHSNGDHDDIWLLDKDPNLIEHLPDLVTMFGCSTIIHIFRDPRDVLLSKKKAAWSRHRSYFRHVIANRAQMLLWKHFVRTTNSDANLFEIQYESLIERPELEMKDLCKMLGMDFHQEMLSFWKSSQALVSDEEMSWKRETLGPLLTNNSNKWEQGLSRWEIVLCEEVCSINMLHGNYRPSEIKSNMTLLERVRMSLVSSVLRVVAATYVMAKRFQAR